MSWKINFHVGKAGVMNSAKMVTWPKPQLTHAALSEFIAAGRKTQKSLLAKPVETISQKSFSIRLRRCKALSFAVLPALQPCATCGKHYNSSTAPIEPSKFCSRQCEVDIYDSFLKIRA